MIDSEHKSPLSRIREKASAESETLLVGLFALIVYIPGIWWGLPYATHPLGVHGWEIDAVTGMQTLSELHNLFIEPKPDWYLAYPPFHYMLVGAAYAPYLAYLFLTGQFSQPSPHYPFGLTDPVTAIRNLTIIARALTVLMAAGIVVNAYLTARVVWDRMTARLAAAAAALPTTMIFYAKTGNLEAPVLFWTSLTLLLMARSAVRGLTIKRAVLIGLFAALAVATKDSAYGALGAGLTALIIFHLRQKTPDARGVSRWKAPAALTFTGLAVFLAASGFFISPYRFFAHISYVRNFDTTFYLVIHLKNLYPQTPGGYADLFFDVVKDLFTAVGPVFFAAGIAGIILSWRESLFAKILTLMLLAHIVLVIFPVRHMQYRYIMVPAFIFAFFIARAFVKRLRHSRKSAAVGVFVIMILGYGWVGLRAVDLTYQMICDARYEAARWLGQNARNNKNVAFFTVQNILPHLEKDTIAVQMIDEPAPVEKITENKIDYILVQPDWSSEIGSDRSRFFPESVYIKLRDGSLGYDHVATFETAPLFRGFYLDLPWITPGYIVNPPVEIHALNKEKRRYENENSPLKNH